MPRRILETTLLVMSAVGLCAVISAGPALAQTENAIYSFTGGNDGADPNSGVVIDAAGNLYGSTFSGGAANQGVVYKLSLTSTGWVQTVIHTFQGGPEDGGNPDGALLLDTSGNIFGTTISGGAGGAGVIFKLSPANGVWNETVLYSLVNHSASSGVIMDQGGNLYGETAGGGTYDDGTVFELQRTNTGWNYLTLYSFAGGHDGNEPLGGLTFDRNSNLYGTTAAGGGRDNIGSVFELRRHPDGTFSERVIHGFDNPGDGVNPEAPVIFDTAGNLYGTTVFGGDLTCGQGFGCGEVFKLSPATGANWSKTAIHLFTDTPDGHGPNAGLTFDMAGNLFSTTGNGGTAGTGTVFKLKSQAGNWTESVVYSFLNGSDGGFPETPVAIDSSGNIFGDTNSGGVYGFGVVYEITGATP